ncbi:MAG: sensor histidine kinase, partial [Vicinamibacterales bacterium]
RAPVELGGLCGRLVDQRAPIAQARAMTLDVVPGDAPTVVMGDATWLTRLFINVLDNAIKFTPEGGHVTVTVGREGAAARVDVTDSGPGMSADVAARAFDPFFRADPARSPATAGAGLGLSLVRWIAERHQARVSFAPAPGGGSTFTIRLPLAPDEETFIEASSGLQAHPL